MDIETLRRICLTLPAATEDIKWGNDLCFSVGAKMFCASSMEQPLQIAFKVDDEEFDELAQAPGFIPAPYMARAKWVMVTDPNRLTKKEWQERIKRSYELVKAKLTAKARKELGIK